MIQNIMMVSSKRHLMYCCTVHIINISRTDHSYSYLIKLSPYEAYGRLLLLTTCMPMWHVAESNGMVLEWVAIHSQYLIGDVAVIE